MPPEGHLGGDWHPRGTETGENKCGQNSHQSEYDVEMVTKSNIKGLGIVNMALCCVKKKKSTVD